MPHLYPIFIQTHDMIKALELSKKTSISDPPWQLQLWFRVIQQSIILALSHIFTAMALSDKFVPKSPVA